MTDFFSAAVKMQREMLAAQKAQIDLAQKMLDAGKQVSAAQQVSQQAAEANLRAWKAWSALWGFK